MERAAKNVYSHKWEQWQERNLKLNTVLEFPAGEIMNERIRGFVWAWAMKKEITIAGVTGKDRFAAHGLEGKIQVNTNLITALLAYRDLPRYRRGILIEKKGGR